MRTPAALLGATLCFDRAGNVLTCEPDAVVCIGARTTRIPVARPRAIAAVADQIWIASGDGELSRFTAAGRPVAAPHVLPAGDGVLVAAPGASATAAWGQVLVADELGTLATRVYERADALLPMGRRRCAVAHGHRIALPSGQLVVLPPTARVLGGVVLADGKAAAVVMAHGTTRQLVVVSLATATLGARYTLAGEARIATARGIAMIRVEPRVLRAIDLRNGRELGSIAVDSDIADHALDADGQHLVLRDPTGALELVDIADAIAPARPLQVTSRRGRYTRGRFAAPDDPIAEVTVQSPATREVLGVWPCGATDVDEAVDSARAASAAWQTLALDERIARVAQIEDGLVRRADELASVLERELGRPASECRREVAGLVPRMRDLAALAETELGEHAQGSARIRSRAHGVAALVSPVMLPLATAHAQLIAAILAGNTVVWKPSSLALASAQLYMEIVDAARLPAGVVNLIPGDAGVGARLFAHGDIDLAVFVGNREHAREVRRATCERLDLATAVHAGTKNVAIVLAGADLAHAAEAIATCAYTSSGQRSTALARVLVEADQLDAFVDALAGEARRLARTPEFACPLVSQSRFERYVDRMHAIAARAIVRPETRPDSLVVSPSVHVADEPSAYLHDELFGPDIAVEAVTGADDAFARLRGHAALYLSVFADDSLRERCEQGSDAGALLWNHAPTAISGRLSFAARGGCERGPRALRAMVRPTVIVEPPAVVRPQLAAGGAS